MAYRSYYRCTDRHCNAKKEVERSLEDPEMLIVTYEGLHLHYISHYLLPKAQEYFSVGSCIVKKPKLQMIGILANSPDYASKESTVLRPLILVTQQLWPEADETGRKLQDKSTHIVDDSMQTFLEDVMHTSEGARECCALAGEEAMQSDQLSVEVQFFIRRIFPIIFSLYTEP